MKKAIPISIGIAAYNESKNIGSLLTSLIEQWCDTISIREILVVSDASTDATDTIVESFYDPRISLIRHNERLGVNGGQNTILERASGDILLLLDADILPVGNRFLEAICAPIVHNSSIGLVSASLVPAVPRTFFESVLARNHAWKNELFGSANMRDSVYACFGPARAFSSRLFREFRYPKDVPPDAYSYFECRERGFRFVLARDAAVVFRCPATIKDHAKQSSRFFSGRDSLKKIFGEKTVRRSYAVPKTPFVKAVISECIWHPILFLNYVVSMVLLRFANRPKSFTSRWDIVSSSKRVS